MGRVTDPLGRKTVPQLRKRRIGQDLGGVVSLGRSTTTNRDARERRTSTDGGSRRIRATKTRTRARSRTAKLVGAKAGASVTEKVSTTSPTETGEPRLRESGCRIYC
jgi:hypothetical protein